MPKVLSNPPKILNRREMAMAKRVIKKPKPAGCAKEFAALLNVMDRDGPESEAASIMHAALQHCLKETVSNVSLAWSGALQEVLIIAWVTALGESVTQL